MTTKIYKSINSKNWASKLIKEPNLHTLHKCKGPQSQELKQLSENKIHIGLYSKEERRFIFLNSHIDLEDKDNSSLQEATKAREANNSKSSLIQLPSKDL